MTFVDRSRAVLAIGVLALWIGGTDAMLKYLRPSMRPWVLTAAFGLIAMGLYGMVRVRQLEPSATHHEKDVHQPKRSRVGWLLVLPIAVLILFGPQPMGDFAIGATPNLPPYAFDIAAYASRVGERQPQLRLADVLQGVKQAGNRTYLATHDVVLIGFASSTGVAGRDSFVLTRFLISCCAADAQPLSVTIVGASVVPEKNQWVEVAARYEPDASNGNKYGPVMRASSVKLIPEPKGPYESLR